MQGWAIGAGTAAMLAIRCVWLTKRKYEGRRGQGISLDWARRFLAGPGSSPPQCTSKCGNCTPCRPVHVAVPPGTPVTAEYYPEAWRCKCGNKLNMP
ncbi:hypothetical protein RJT34_12451 [Clitoria ternatea]|uniref:Epidermal patterning factor-like protein n=1 Tax=Clitoria ternatea TaxID=43366 RepID=A0AAN9JQC7_CLITE